MGIVLPLGPSLGHLAVEVIRTRLQMDAKKKGSDGTLLRKGSCRGGRGMEWFPYPRPTSTSTVLW